MRKLILTFFAVIAAGCASTQVATPPTVVKMSAARAALKARGKRHLIVFNKKDFKRKIRMNLMSEPVQALGKATGGKVLKQMELINGFVVEADDNKPLPKVGGDWVVQEEVEYHTMETLYRLTPVNCGTPTPTPVPTPPPTPSPTPTPTPPGQVEPDSSWGRARVKAALAMAKVDTSKVKICDVDTGIDMNHPNKGNVIYTKDWTGSGIADVVGHGSHTAGTIAGQGNGVGMSKAALIIEKGLDNSGSGSSQQLAQAGMDCVAQGANIASFSWGSPQSDPMINQMVSYLTSNGIAVVIAAGNDGKGTVNWPAANAISNSLVFAISASDQNDRITSFSSYGQGTKFIAPGMNIVSNKPGGGTQTMSGTSMATPHVAGLMAYCAALGKPFASCLKTDVLSLTSLQQGSGLPRGDLTVQ